MALIAMRNVNERNVRPEAHVWLHRTSAVVISLCSSWTVCHSVCTRTTHPRSENAVAVTSVAALTGHGGILVENKLPVWLNGAKSPGDIFVEDTDDGVLSHVLNGVSLRIIVGYARILVIIVPPKLSACDTDMGSPLTGRCGNDLPII